MRSPICMLMIGATIGAIAVSTAQAQVNVGITVSETGPAAALGIPQKNTVAQLPKEIGGQKIRYTVLDDGTDPTRAVANARKMISEEKIDILIGSSATPASMALVDVAAETKTPYCGMVPAKALVLPVDAKRRWVFKTPQDEELLAEALADHMQAHGVKSIGFIGYTDGYGQGWLDAVKKLYPAKGIKIVAVERFQRSDTSVAAQSLKVISANPDAVLIAASGTVAVLPQRTLREQGYSKQIYQTAGISTMEFVRVGGKDVEGTIFTAGPVMVENLLPDSNPIKKVATAYIEAYETINKTPFSGFGAHLADCATLMLGAVPKALTKGRPGTAEFRAAIRDGVEAAKEVVANHGIYNYSSTDHAGLDKRAVVLIKIVNGKWTLLP